jgi:hypothetical protein
VTAGGGGATPVPDDHGVLRLPVPPKDFTPERWRPTSKEFEPTNPEKDEAAQAGRSVRISVWDEHLTTPAQARAFRGRDCIVLRGSAGAIRTAGFPVVFDPLEEPDAQRPGAVGHAAIENVGRDVGEPKVQWRSRLEQLADLFELLTT